MMVTCSAGHAAQHAVLKSFTGVQEVLPALHDKLVLISGDCTPDGVQIMQGR